MIHIDKRKWIYISLCNPFKTMKRLKGIFKPLKVHFNYSFDKFAPNSVLWCSKPAFIHIMSCDVMWKDKYDSPRFEHFPYIWIHLWKFNLVWYWVFPSEHFYDNDEYWEQALWYLYYTPCMSIENAKKSWPWTSFKTKESTWNNDYLL